MVTIYDKQFHIPRKQNGSIHNGLFSKQRIKRNEL